MWKEQVSTHSFQPLQDPGESQIKAPCDSTPNLFLAMLYLKMISKRKTKAMSVILHRVCTLYHRFAIQRGGNKGQNQTISLTEKDDLSQKRRKLFSYYFLK